MTTSTFWPMAVGWSVGEAGNAALPAAPVQFGVVLDGLFELIIGLVGHAVLEARPE